MGKKGKHLWVLCLIAGLMLWYIPAVLARFEEQGIASQLLQVMESTGARATGVEVRASVETGYESSTQEIDQAANAWLKNLGIADELEPGKWKQGLYIQQKVTEIHGIRLHFQMIGVPDNGRYIKHVIFSIMGKPDQLQVIESMQNTISAAFWGSGKVPQFSTCIRGLYSDKLSVDWQKGKILSIFDALQAQVLESMVDDTVVSISGYTRLWQPHIKLYDQKMNLQVATHQDTATGETRITVGTPIITAEY